MHAYKSFVVVALLSGALMIAIVSRYRNGEGLDVPSLIILIVTLIVLAHIWWKNQRN